MRVEVLCTGDELLTGLTVDTNSPYFMAKLFLLGEQVRCTTLVGDFREDIEEALRTTSGRADVVLVSGGLGPTTDDLTAECAAAVANRPLVEDAATLERMKARFAHRGLAFTENNRRQARVPEGAEICVNPQGSAPMFILGLGRATVFFLPGVPREYKALVDAEVLPRLSRMLEVEPGRVYRASRLLRTVGIAESHLDARVAPLARKYPSVRIGFRTQAPENHLKLLAQEPSQARADATLAAVEADARALLGVEFIFGSEDDRFATVIGHALQARGETLALAESCTGGRVADLLTEAPGSSRYFLGSAVSYANGLKQAWLHVKPETLEAHGAVSAQVAVEMAEGARRVAKSSWALSITGIAGPGGGTDAKPVGTVFCALAGEGATQAREHHFVGDREQIRQASAYAALDLLRRTLHALEKGAP